MSTTAPIQPAGTTPAAPAPPVTTAGADDYVSVRRLYEFLQTLEPGTLVDLGLVGIEYRRAAFDPIDGRHLCTEKVHEVSQWNVVYFENNNVQSPIEKLCEKLAQWVCQGRGHAHVCRGRSPLTLKVTRRAVLTLDTQLRNWSLWDIQPLNPFYADGLLMREAVADPAAARALLSARYGADAAEHVELFAVGTLWFNRPSLLKRYPRLACHTDWPDLFPTCGVGALRRCVLDDAAMSAEFGEDRTLVRRLLERARPADRDGSGPERADPRPGSAYTVDAEALGLTPTERVRWDALPDWLRADELMRKAQSVAARLRVLQRFGIDKASADAFAENGRRWADAADAIADTLSESDLLLYCRAHGYDEDAARLADEPSPTPSDSPPAVTDKASTSPPDSPAATAESAARGAKPVATGGTRHVCTHCGGAVAPGDPDRS